MRDFCEVAYALMVEETERNVAPIITGQAVARAMGGKGEVTTLADARRSLDEWLSKEPEKVDVAEQVKRAALGLTRGR